MLSGDANALMMFCGGALVVCTLIAILMYVIYLHTGTKKIKAKVLDKICRVCYSKSDILFSERAFLKVRKNKTGNYLEVVSKSTYLEYETYYHGERKVFRGNIFSRHIGKKRGSVVNLYICRNDASDIREVDERLVLLLSVVFGLGLFFFCMGLWACILAF